MKDFQQRVVDEHTDLENKIEKLDTFLESDLFDSVSPEEQHLLVQQLYVMELYSDILSSRIKAFEA